MIVGQNPKQVLQFEENAVVIFDFDYTNIIYFVLHNKSCLQNLDLIYTDFNLLSSSVFKIWKPNFGADIESATPAPPSSDICQGVQELLIKLSLQSSVIN